MHTLKNAYHAGNERSLPSDFETYIELVARAKSLVSLHLSP